MGRVSTCQKNCNTIDERRSTRRDASSLWCQNPGECQNVSLHGSSIIQSRSWHEDSGSNEPEQQGVTLAASGVKTPVNDKMSASMVARLFNLGRDMRNKTRR